MSSKPLTPQEFEDRYLSRPAEQPKAEKEATAERNDIKQVLSKPADIISLFKLNEGVEERVRTYYDAAFDKAFENVPLGGEPSYAETGVVTLPEIKRLKADGIAWGRMTRNEVINGELSCDVEEILTNIKLGNAQGVVALYTIGDMSRMTNQGQMSVFAGVRTAQDMLFLSPEPLSWKLAAINLAGGISRFPIHHETYGNKVNVALKMQEVVEADGQIQLADTLSDGFFSAEIGHTLEAHYGVLNIQEFKKKVPIKAWSRDLTNAAFDRKNQPLGKSEELMRSRLCVLAAIRHFAYKKAGKAAEPKAKVNEFAKLYFESDLRLKVHQQYKYIQSSDF